MPLVLLYLKEVSSVNFHPPADSSRDLFNPRSCRRSTYIAFEKGPRELTIPKKDHKDLLFNFPISSIVEWLEP